MLPEIRSRPKMPTYNLRRFRVSRIANNSVVFALGRRGSGKTTGIINIFSSKRKDFKMGIAFCGNQATAQEYAKVMPDLFNYDDYQPEVLKEFIDRQELRVKQGGRKNTPYVFVILDDCFWQKSDVTNDPQFLRLLNNGRNYNIFFVCSMHYAFTIKPNMRMQIDYVFICREDMQANRKRLYDSYNVCFNRQAEFDACLEATTQDYGMMVITNTAAGGKGTKIEDKMAWWRGKAIEDGGARFKINKRGRWWKYARLHYDPKYYTRPDPEPEPVARKRGTRVKQKVSVNLSRRR
jgi:hypothetical protein